MRTQSEFFSALVNGAKWGVPVSISRSGSADGGLPLDTYSIFKSKAEAEVYASLNKANVEAAGFVNNGYVGQIITVWGSDDKVEIYYINSDRTLKPVGIIPKGDDKLVSVTADGLISLFGSEDAVAGTLPLIGTGGKIEWKTLEDIGAGDGNTQYTVTPIKKTTQVVNGETTTSVEEIYGFSIISDNKDAVATEVRFDVYTKKEIEKYVADAIAVETQRATNEESRLERLIGAEAKTEGETTTPATGVYHYVDTQLSNVYKKSEVYTKEETNSEISKAVSAAEVGKLTKLIVDSVNVETKKYVKDGEEKDIVEHVIYLVKASNKGGDMYKEYMFVDGEVIQTGDTTTDLSEYLKSADAATTYVSKNDANADGTGFLTKNSAADTYLSKLDAGNTYLSKNEASTTYITPGAVAETYLTKENAGTTYVEKVTAEGTGTGDAKGVRFISQEEINKLGKLELGEGGNLEVSGSVNADNVKGLYDKVRKIILNATDSTEDLATDKEGVQAGLGIEANAQENKIESIKLDSESSALSITNKTVVLDVYSKNAADLKVKAVSDELGTLKDSVNTHHTQSETRLAAIEAKIPEFTNEHTQINTAITVLQNTVNGTEAKEHKDGLVYKTATNTDDISKLRADVDNITKADEGLLAGKVDKSVYDEKVLELTQLIGGKASQSDLNTLSQTVNGKAAQSDLTALSQKVDGMYTNTQIDTAVNGAKDAVLAVIGGYDANNTVKEAVDENKRLIDTLIGTEVDENGTNISAGKSVRAIAADVLAEKLVPENAKDSLDTLAEIAAWIQAHPDDAAKMNKDIEANKVSLAALIGKPEGNNVLGADGAIMEAIANATPAKATNTTLGVVQGSTAENKVSVDSDGIMSVNSVNVDKLVQTAGTWLVLNGGGADS